MTRHIAQCLSHSIESYQQLDLLSSIGHEVVDIGPYIDPAHPEVDMRPALPHVPPVPGIKEAIEAVKAEGKEPQEALPDAVLDWADTIIFHHKLERLFGQWPRIKDWLRGSSERRVIWRSVGQSVEANEKEAAPFRISGLERVAYSPKEVNIPSYSGHDAVIRFWAEQDDDPWTGGDLRVLNIAQDLRRREPFTNWGFWESATKALPRYPIGPGSETIGGGGTVPYRRMKARLHSHRAFLYCGTQPASYSLGLLEAMAAGIPTVSIGPAWMSMFPYGPKLYEGHELAPLAFDDPMAAHHALRRLLHDDDYAQDISRITLAAAKEHFDRDKIASQWAEFLS